MFKNFLVKFLEYFLKPSRIPEIQKENIKSILVVRQHDQLGDMLCAVPLLRTLRTLFPDAYIALIASPVNYEIMKHHPYVNEVLNYDKQVLSHSFDDAQKFVRTLRARQFDLAIVPATVSVSVTSDVLALLSGARIRIGAKSLQGKPNQTSFCFTHPIELDWCNEPHRHQTLRNLDSLRVFDYQENDLSGSIGLTDEEQMNARNYLEPYQNKYNLLIGFHPGAGKGENRWNAKKFSEIANKLFIDYQACTVITAGGKDAEALQEMIKHLNYPYVIVQNQPIRSVAAIINELDAFVSNDTGIMHVAAGTKTPLLSLFGPTDPLQWSPLGLKNHYVASDNGTMESISTEQVYSELQQIISKSNL